MKRKVSSVYIHFPYCRQICNYCDFYRNVPSKEGDWNDYHQFLLHSINSSDLFLNDHSYMLAPLETLYVGGGTPSLWGVAGADFLSDHIISMKGFAKKYEFTIEVNPGVLTKVEFEIWRNLGLNRVSLGLQSLDSRFLKLIGRIHSLEESFISLDQIAGSGIDFSVDFMIGLPESHRMGRSVVGELEKVLQYDPNHISLYVMTVGDNYIHKELLPNDEWIEREYMDASSFLKEKGFLHYEVSNFAKPGHESRHNLKYWRSESVVAFGPSATGFLSGENCGVRYKWRSDRPCFDLEEISNEKMKLEKFYMLFRTNIGVRGSDFFTGNSKSRFEDILKNWNKKGLAKEEDGVVRVTSKGYLLLDSMIDDLFKVDII